MVSVMYPDQRGEGFQTGNSSKRISNWWIFKEI